MSNKAYIYRPGESFKISNSDLVIIARAKEHIMTSYGLDESAAYQFIRRVAMNNKRSRVEIARRILQDDRDVEKC